MMLPMADHTQTTTAKAKQRHVSYSGSPIPALLFLTLKKHFMRSHFYTLVLALWGCYCFTNTAPAHCLTISFAVTNPHCSGAFNGSVTANVSGGTAPYTYNWSNGVTASTNPNLGAGTYGLTVTSANGASAAQSATVQDP